jgi:Spy/CpxP family protein refolding chaperone
MRGRANGTFTLTLSLRAMCGEGKNLTVPRKAEWSLLPIGIETLLQLVCLVVVWACAPVRPACASETPTPGPVLSAPATTRTPDKDANERSRLRRVARAWWHEAQLITVLKLTDEQQARMDAILVQRMETRHKLLAGYSNANAQFQEALTTGDWSVARRHMAEMRELAAAEVESRAKLRLEVFEVLSADQRRTLVEKYPNVVTRPWLPGYGPRRSVATRARTPHETPSVMP